MTWPNPALDESLLVALVRDGNRAHAARLNRAWDGDRPGRAQRIQQTAAASPAVFAPVVVHHAPEPSFVSRLLLAPEGSHGPNLHPDSVAAIDAALDAAWTLTRHEGPRPRCGARLPLAEALGVPVAGRSFFLPALLAGVVHFSETPLTHNVLATGHPGDDIRSTLAIKLSLARSRRDELGHEALWVAASHSPGALVDDGGRWCRSPEEAVDAVFGHRPWGATADIPRWHLHAGRDGAKARPPTRGAGWRAVPLPFPITPEHLPTVLADVLRHLEGAGSGEVSIAGPLYLAAALGWELKNLPGTLRLIHRDAPWWRRGTPVGPDASPSPRLGPRVLITGRRRREDGWSSLDLVAAQGPARDALPGDLPRLLSRLLASLPPDGPMDVACDGPMPVAWALGETLRNVRSPVRFFDRVGHAYQHVFTGTRHGVEPAP